MPHIARFFAQGTIFDEHFSTSECTYPALPVIETGRYPHHTQVFNERDSHEIPLDFKTLSECMSDLGYYAAAPMGASDSVYCSALRGYLLNVAAWKLPSAEMVDRAIMQMEAFHETDQFLYLHTTDVHPWNAKGFKFYPTLAHLADFPVAEDIDGNLPAVFGSTPRDAVYSLSIFPRQTFKLAVRHTRTRCALRRLAIPRMTVRLTSQRLRSGSIRADMNARKATRWIPQSCVRSSTRAPAISCERSPATGSASHCRSRYEPNRRKGRLYDERFYDILAQ